MRGLHGRCEREGVTARGVILTLSGLPPKNRGEEGERKAWWGKLLLIEHSSLM